MKIIGINYLSESSACLLVNGSIFNAISEERINRTKNWYGLPRKTIDFILKKNNLKAKNKKQCFMDVEKLLNENKINDAWQIILNWINANE